MTIMFLETTYILYPVVFFLNWLVLCLTGGQRPPLFSSTRVYFGQTLSCSFINISTLFSAVECSWAMKIPAVFVAMEVL